MPDALTAVAALFTIWAQSSILAENGEFERFKEQAPTEQELRLEERQRRQEEILTAAIDRREQILLANQRVISQTQLR